MARTVTALKVVGQDGKDGSKGIECPSSSIMNTTIYKAMRASAALFGLYKSCQMGYKIRMGAIQNFGTVIHEYDPYFNFRATEYLYENGAEKFFSWYDYKSWYPLGRPVGTTIYPGMQFTAVWIKQFVIGESMNLNDVCCYIPVWFGVLATLFTAGITYECALQRNSSNSIFGIVKEIFYPNNEKKVSAVQPNNNRALECATFAAFIMGILPAHLMRSIGGGFDNESIAMTAMTSTFYFWVRSLRAEEKASPLFGAVAGVAYFYMAASWGGYVFVLNMVAIHAAFLVLLGRFTTKTYLSFSLFYSIGTCLAMQIPVIGMTPLKSLEQLPACAVFLGYQLLQLIEVTIRRNNLERSAAMKFRFKAVSMLAIIGFCTLLALIPTGFFGPVSSRVRALFIKAAKTGNPLVDSVQEHAKTDPEQYYQWLHILCTVAPIGFVMTMFNFGDGPAFVITYSTFAYFFSFKMTRLVLLAAPAASVLGGLAFGRVTDWAFKQLLTPSSSEEHYRSDSHTHPSLDHRLAKRAKAKKSKAKEVEVSIDIIYSEAKDSILSNMNSSSITAGKKVIGIMCLLSVYYFGDKLHNHSFRVSEVLSSNTQIVLYGQASNELGEQKQVVIDDYREAYWWMKENTPEDARIMAWWDYGYQITSIANRTTLADGNTWNHEHIALLGKILTTKPREAHEIARHLGDYIFIVAGKFGGTDISKSPALIQIANSVYRDTCPNDPHCSQFGYTKDKQPSPAMRSSLIYNLHSHGFDPLTQLDSDQFVEVYRSKWGGARVYKIMNVDEKSKAWVSDPKNRKCENHHWSSCRGQYPPALEKVLKKSRNFKQLEDFRKTGGTEDAEYQKQYFEAPKPVEKKQNPQKITLNSELVRKYNSVWEDNEQTTLLWNMIHENNQQMFSEIMFASPELFHARSSDGRGPMWWAHEMGRTEMITMLKHLKVKDSLKDARGLAPKDIAHDSMRGEL